MLAFIGQLPISTILIIISIIIITAALIQKNSNFLDVRAIFKNHFKIFFESPLQFCVLFFVPILLSVATVLTSAITENIMNNLNVVLAILMAMFFSMLSILCSFGKKANESSGEIPPKAKRYNQLLKETFNAVMFECIVCVILLVVSFAQVFTDDFTQSAPLIIISGFIYYLTFVVILNIFVVVKRLRVLFNGKDE